MGVRIILAEDHRITREGLVNLLQERSDMQVAGEAENGREAVRLARELSPDLVIMDVTMPDLNGIDATRIITSGSNNTKVIALSMYSDKQFVQGMIVDSEVEIRASRLLLYDIACKYDQGMDVSTDVFLVKPFVIDTAIRIIDRAIQIHGGYGYSSEYPVERMYRDARVMTIGEGTSEIQRLVISRLLLS